MTVETEFDEKTGTWIAEVVEVPGAMESHVNRDEAIQLAQNAAVTALQLYVKAGLPLPVGLFTVLTSLGTTAAS